MKHKIHKSVSSGAIYGLGFIGAAIYFISHAAGFWMGVPGFLKKSMQIIDLHLSALK